MWSVKARIIIMTGFLLLGTWGCAHTISPEMRQRARTDLTFQEVLQNPMAYIGSTVIWGGVIIETLNRSDGTIITVLETPLDYQEMPTDAVNSRGRFIAKVSQYLDSEVYQKGRKITLAGDIIGKETGPVGEIQYTYPVVQVKELHLWRERAMGYYPYPYYWDWYGARYYYWP
jgi:outer membrane lipoprotein